MCGLWRLLAVSLLAPALGGCGLQKPEPDRGGTPQAQATATPAPARMDASVVDDLPRGTPQRAVFEFWHAVQYRDLLSAYRLLTPEFQRNYAKGLRRFGTYLMADYGRWLTRPAVISTRVSGDEATVALRYRSQAGGDDVTSFSLVRGPEGWLIGYEFYLVNRLSGK